MKLNTLKNFVGKIPLAARLALGGLHLYEWLVWFCFARLFSVYCLLRPGACRRPQRIGSVLHVSALSHKPYMLSRLMRAKGLRSEYLAVHAEAGWLQVGERGYDYNIPWTISTLPLRPFIAIYYFWKLMRHYDVIHYHFASFISTGGYELPLLRRMGKLSVFHFRGCDLRQKSVNNRMNPDLNCCQECDYPGGSCENEAQQRRIRLAREYGDLLLVTTPDLLDFLPEAEHIPFISTFGVDFDGIDPAARKNGTFRVVTSSNHHGVDGTQYVRGAVQKLHDEGIDIELVEVHHTPYEQALAIYKSADVYVGKLRMGYYNNANIECMAMGVPCMSYVRDNLRARLPDCPIIQTRPETVYDNLKYYYGHSDELRAAGEHGPGFVRKHHAPVAGAETLLGRYHKALQQAGSTSPNKFR